MKFSEIKSYVESDEKFLDKKTEFLGGTVFIKQSLSSEVIQDLLKNVREISFLNDGRFNPLFYEMALGEQLVLKFTDIAFAKHELEAPFTVYDVIERSGLIAHVMANVPEEELSTLLDLVNETIEEEKTYRQTFQGFISDMLSNIPLVSEAIGKTFDDDVFEKVMLAINANGDK